MQLCIEAMNPNATSVRHRFHFEITDVKVAMFSDIDYQFENTPFEQCMSVGLLEKSGGLVNETLYTQRDS